MKKTYTKPAITLVGMETASVIAASTGYTIGEDGEKGNQENGPIDKTDGNGFIQESKGNGLWEDDWDE